MFYDNAEIAGWPVSSWISLTEESYSIGMGGAYLHSWPDGKSLMEQEQCVVDIFKIVVVEMIKEFTDGS